MITIPLMGGLGNQLFQIAFVVRLRAGGVNARISWSIVNNRQVCKALGWTMHPNPNTRVLCEALNVPVIRLKPADYLSLARIYIHKRLGLVSLLDLSYESALKINKFNSGCEVLPGYFQSEKHLEFKDVSLVARKYKSIICSNNNGCNKVVVHVRRGDFAVDSLIRSDCYKQILSGYIESDIGFVTNDVEYVKREYSFYIKRGAVVVRGGSLFDDFSMISEANIIVGSNSTFSYMASCASDAQVIYMPDFLSVNTRCLFPLDDRFTKYSAVFD